MFVLAPVVAAMAEAITLVSPVDGAEVPLLSEKQRAFMQMSREERATFFDDAQPKKEKAIKRYRSEPQPVALNWTGGGGPSVSRRRLRQTSSTRARRLHAAC